MLKILGERKAYGQKSPLNAVFERAGVPYRGTRTSNGYQKAPWYLYESAHGSASIDLVKLEKILLEKGFVEEVERGRGGVSGSRTSDARHYSRDSKQGSESIHVINYMYDNPKKNHSHIGHMFFF